MKVTHWQGCTTDRTHTWAGRRYCRGCGVWLDPPHVPRYTTITDRRIVGDKQTGPASAATLNRPLEAEQEPRDD